MVPILVMGEWSRRPVSPVSQGPTAVVWFCQGYGPGAACLPASFPLEITLLVQKHTSVLLLKKGLQPRQREHARLSGSSWGGSHSGHFSPLRRWCLKRGPSRSCLCSEELDGTSVWVRTTIGILSSALKTGCCCSENRRNSWD